MCLAIKKMVHSTSNKEVTFYKIFKVRFDDLITPYRWNLISFPGTIKAKGEWDTEWDLIGKGVCHAFKTKSRAKKYDSTYFELYSTTIVPIKVKKKHIIAYGKNGDVCFTQYRIMKYDWEKIFKKGN